MGIKDVFDRMKGKSNPKGDRARDGAKADAANGRNAHEETVQVKIADANSPRSSNRGAQDQTVLAPPVSRPMPQAPVQSTPATVPNIVANRSEATVVAPPLSAPVPQPPPPSVAQAASPPVPQPTPPSVPQPAAPAVPQSAPAAAVPPAAPPTPAAPPPAAAAPVAAPPVAAPVEASQAQPSSTIPIETKSAEPVATPGPVSSGEPTEYVTPDTIEVDVAAGVLVGIFGETRNQVYLLKNGQCTLGRSETCDLQILDPKVSREHAAIFCDQGAVSIQALNDRNPVFVNDAAIASVVTIADGDKIQFGNTGASIFRFRTITGL